MIAFIVVTLVFVWLGSLYTAFTCGEEYGRKSALREYRSTIELYKEPNASLRELIFKHLKGCEVYHTRMKHRYGSSSDEDCI